MELLRKLTIKACGGWTQAKIKESLSGKKDGEGADLIKVVGRTTGAKTGQTDKGSYTLLMGDFYGTSMDTGEVFQSAKCILPNFISETLSAALAQSPAVEFALVIGAKVNTTSVTGYEFTVRPLIEAKPTETMLALLSAAGIDPAAKALPAPEKPAPAKKAAKK